MTELLELVQGKVKGCRRCWLGEANSGPVPYRGPEQPQILILGEAPGKEEDEKNEPFIGPAGRHLVKLIRQTTLNPAVIGYTNVINCIPKKGMGVRPPKRPEIDACRVNLEFQLRVLRPKVVMLAGRTALAEFRPELKVTKVRGRPMVFDVGAGPFVAIPMLHPAGLMRAKSKKLNDEAIKDLKQARWRLKHDELDRWPEDCVLCHQEVEVYDVNGVPWCEGHRTFAREEVGLVPTGLQMELR